MRLIPDSRFAGMPCSYTGTATAYEKTRLPEKYLRIHFPKV